MKILHYSLGFPPYRTGGMTKFCVDLALSQKKLGHDVGIIWPGEITLWKKNHIKRRKDYFGIQNYEIINPLPVPLDEGVLNPELFMQSGSKSCYEKFINKVKPDILHIHTLMGLHKELLDVAKEHGVKTVFTTHDYYGICPKVTLFKEDHVCEDYNDCKKCPVCNQTGLSYTKIVILQSSLYRKIKNSALMRVLRQKHRKKYFDTEKEMVISDTQIDTNWINQYSQLRKFYLHMLIDMDSIHFNSSVSKEIYSRFIKVDNFKVIPVAHLDINDHRRIKNYNHDIISITYLGPLKQFKGFTILKQALDELWDEGNRNFELQIFDELQDLSPYMIAQDKYKYDELESIFSKTDIMVAPSVWFETFGFTVLEALSYGVPVIISENVGAKDIVPKNCGIVVKANDVNYLKETIRKLNREILSQMNQNIVDLPCIISMKDIVDKIHKSLY